MSDFVIENGVLEGYTGKDADVIIPDGVTKICNRAFYGCSSLASVSIPDSVTEIGWSAFYGCSSLTSITIPDSVTEIGWSAFDGCDKLSEVHISDLAKWCDIKFDGLESNPLEYAHNLYLNGEHVTDLVIPDGVTKIGDWAFSGCSSLTSVTIPDSITEIGGSAFSECKGLIYNEYDNALYLGNAKNPYLVLIKAKDKSIKNIKISDTTRVIYCSAFSDCSSITSVTIPDSVTEIGEDAFSGCTGLTSVTIPDSVTKIGDRAFSGCSSLTSVTIPDGVTKIGNWAFEDCDKLCEVHISDLAKWCSIKFGSWSSNPLEYAHNLYLNGEHVTDLVIPDGVTKIGSSAFSGCSSLTSVTIPDSVTKIGDDAFRNCSGLTSITIPDGVKGIGERAFSYCRNLMHVVIRKKKAGLLNGSLSSGVCVEYKENNKTVIFAAGYDKHGNVVLPDIGKMNEYDSGIINNGPEYKFKVPVRLIAAMSRLAAPDGLTEECRGLYVKYLKENVKKAVSAAVSIDRPHLVKALFDNGIIDDGNSRAVKKLLDDTGKDEFSSLASQKAKAVVKKEERLDPLAAEYQKKLDGINADKIFADMKMMGRRMPQVRLKNGETAPEQLFRFLIASYSDPDNLKIDKEADDAAGLLAYDSLCGAIDEISDGLDFVNYQRILPLFCRYANASQIKNALKKTAGMISSISSKERNASRALYASLVLSDTRTAVVELEKHGSLEKYAELRGITVDQVYADILFDFGFDDNCEYSFDLKTTVVTATLTPDLKIALYDTVNKKAVKTLPKKGADPELHKKLSDELDDMKKNLSKAVKIKKDQLFAEYISKKKYTVGEWKKAYLSNPLLKKIAGMLIWKQGRKTFLPTADGLITSDGKEYAITDENIYVAHTMEMKNNDISAWQKYVNGHGIIQPFPQIWEHAYERNEIKPDRYSGIKIRDVYLSKQGKRGISCDKEYDYGKHGSRFFYGVYLYIDNFDLVYDSAVDEETNNVYVDIKEIKPKTWNRQTNNTVAFLDRITVFGRVAKDDITIADHLPDFTLAQIMDMIRTAEENKAINVAALLIEYKNKTYPDYDPMDEFTLDW